MEPEKDKNKVEISVIITALNEEKNISLAINNVLKSLADYKIEGEVIAVNDGSTDKTEELIKAIMEKDSRVRMIKHQTPKGVGASFWEGVDKAFGYIVVWIPGDNENDSWETFRYYKLLEHVDMVIPFAFNKEVRSIFRNILSYIYRVIVNTTFRVNFNYTNGTVLYRKSILSRMDYKSDGFFFQTEILIKMAKQGYLFAEVPYRLGLRSSGVSKAISFPSFLQVVKGYFDLVRDIYFRDKGVKEFSSDSLSRERHRLDK